MSNCEKSGDTLEGIFIGTVEFKVEFTGTSDGLRKYFIDSIVRNNENETIERFHHTKNSESIDDFFLNQQPKRNRGGRR
ncbi:MAG: hypothetical protein Hyperionvirus4_10 [Hyperionvirus sp.]|uniref:Uncharacterized protein n=1 Tax=Hyperionvirus sp. TaxID=2487770 RepID=A0A3G5A727_9VIRU|nr:MAG: hypothetical protein Hyperionvirus4_10 [Hyperionvirus sp.]